MWKLECDADGPEPLDVALYVPTDSVTRTIVDTLDQFGCRFRYLNTPADVHRCFVGGATPLAVIYVGTGAGVFSELLNGYRKVQGSGSEPFLVAIGEDRVAVRRAAWAAGAGDYIAVPLLPEQAVERLRLAVRAARWLDGFRRNRFRLEREVTRNTRLLQDTRLEITRLLGRAAEFRDNETGRHVLRVSQSCEVVARELGLPEADVTLITHASPLHDIGKIGVPDRILLKPGPLTDVEWRQMKRHTVIGAQILAGNDDPLLTTARTVALTHHERWDGSGYPRRLKGARIPMAGRIVAVCDTFDALTSARPYKQPWPIEDAFAYVSQEAGHQFDPDVASVFLRVRDEITRISTANADVGHAPYPRSASNIGVVPSGL